MTFSHVQEDCSAEYDHTLAEIRERYGENCEKLFSNFAILMGILFSYSKTKSMPEGLGDRYLGLAAAVAGQVCTELTDSEEESMWLAERMDNLVNRLLVPAPHSPQERVH